VHPRRRDETPDLAAVNPLQRVPSLREGDVTLYETSAVLQYVAERFPEAGLAPPVGDSRRGAYLRWLAWLGNTLHDAYEPLNVPQFLTDDPTGHDGIRSKGRAKLDAIGAYLEEELSARRWCLGEQYTVADVYLYMLVAWQSYVEGGYVLGADAVQSHFARVGVRPAIMRARELDDLDERLKRYRPELRGGKPI
jgi:glutathione S-transferase